MVSSPVLGRYLFSFLQRNVSMIMKCLLGLLIELPEVILDLKGFFEEER